MTPTPHDHRSHYILVPGFWLGAWAWDRVAPALRDSGARVTALTLPGSDSPDTARDAITLDDRVEAILAAVRTTAEDEDAILVVHSGAGPVGYAVSDRVPEDLARVVYVDSGPMPHGAALRPDLPDSTVEIPLPTWAELEADGNSLDGLDTADLEEFAARAVPEPAGPARTPLDLTDDRRLELPTTVVCSSFPAEVITRMAQAGHPMAAELARIRHVDYVDLPTGHWPMWSRPDDLASAVLDAVRA